MLITVMFLTIANKSRTFFSFPYSANDRSAVQELGGSTARHSSSWAMEIFHTIDNIRSFQMGVGQEVGIIFYHEFGLFHE